MVASLSINVFWEYSKNMKKASIIILLIAVGCAAIAFFVYRYGSFNIPPMGEPPVAGPSATSSLAEFSVPEGFAMSIFADDIPDARVMAFAPNGVLLVSQPAEGTISAVLDANSDGVAEQRTIVISDLNLPHGLAFRCTDPEQPDKCDLYVAEKDQLSVFSYDAITMKASGQKKLLDLPDGSLGTHFTRTLQFLAAPNDSTLLIAIGSSCNVCHEDDSRRASVITYDVVTGKSEQFAVGLRNSVFMALHPVTGDVWATEMGRDGLGDNTPPDEINIIRKGGNYGWPICYGKNIHDTSFDKNTYIRNPCMTPFETPSHVDLQAHSAPLGLSFIPEEGWPEAHWFNLLVAYHGSWNRSEPTGYKIVKIALNADGTSVGATEDFITGWLRPDGTRIGRPADIHVLPGGTIYISDDEAGRVYIVRRMSEE